MRGLLVVLAVLAAGCSAPAEGVEGPLTCEEAHAGERSGNVALVAAWQDGPDHVLTRLAQAVGDATVGAPTPEPDGLQWETQRGEVRWTPAPSASWTPREPVADTRATLAAALEAFQPPPGIAFADDGRAAWQTMGDERIVGTGASWAEGTLRVDALYEVDPDAALLPASELQARAVTLAACVDEDAGEDAELVELRADDAGLVRRARVASGPEGCSEALVMDLDASTGGLVGPVYCGAP